MILKSKKLYLLICFENGPNEKRSVFVIFIVKNLNMQVLIWSYLQFLLIKYKNKINAFQQLQGGLCNDFDSSSLELKIFESSF